MESDKELLELAAKAAGFKFEFFVDGRPIRREIDGQPVYWNPLADDGDALRLAVRLHLDITMYPATKEIGAVQHKHNGVCYGTVSRCFERTGADPCAAARRAIVRAAAEIGKSMP